ncbi:MAG: sugar phosphate isomerase/epimerase [Lachnospiraceae bacterium]|nr:sugar phosphate isomerase/epimerase [Lachnospiraceae bacterium]
MKLGIIAPVAEESFRYAQTLGLDFVEFCINGPDHGELLHQYKEELPLWMEKYQVSVGSIGRWKSVIQLPDGSIDPKELEIARDLMEIAKELHCPHYICGCNYVASRSKFSNYISAVSFFEAVLEDVPSGVDVSVYNCRKGNFVNNQEAWSLVLEHLPALGIKFDPSHSRYAGSDYLEELVDWGERIRHVHLKGSMIVNGQRIDDPPAGLDQTDWKSILNILRTKNYQGGLSIEPHSPVWSGEIGEKGVRYTVQYFKELMM